MLDCLSAALQRTDAFDGRSSLSTWLLGIMKFKTIDHFRKSKCSPADQAVHFADKDDSRQDPVDSLFTSKGARKVAPNHGLEILAYAPDDLTIRNELMTWVHACMEKLPERLRTLFSVTSPG